MDIFALTETEFFRKLTDGENDNLHIAYKDFVLQVSELCNSSKCKGNVITALLLVEVEISHLQTEEGRLSVNNTLSSFISKALTFVRQTLSHYKERRPQLEGKENRTYRNRLCLQSRQMLR